MTAAPELPAAYRVLHEDARRVLAAFHPPTTEQARLRAEFLAHLDARSDALWRHGPPAHLTASVVVFDESLERVLLTHHAKAGEWFQFGGHAEEGDGSVWEVAAREAREESGIEDVSPLRGLVQLDRHRLVGSFGRCREHLDLRYAAMVPAAAAHRASAESLDVRWWPVSGLPEGSRVELSPLVTLASAALVGARA